MQHEIEQNCTKPFKNIPKLLRQILKKIHQLDRKTERVLRAIRSKYEQPLDNRSPQERKLIDRAALHYVRRRYLDGVDISKSESIRLIWKKHGDETLFRDYNAFANAVRYDLDQFYDMETLIAHARTAHEI